MLAVFGGANIGSSGGTQSSLVKTTFGGGGPAMLTSGKTIFYSLSPSGR